MKNAREPKKYYDRGFRLQFGQYVQAKTSARQAASSMGQLPEGCIDSIDIDKSSRVLSEEQTELCHSKNFKFIVT